MEEASGSSKSLILKSDVRGRVLTPLHRREELLNEFERSGLSGPKFAALVGIKYSTFAGWAHRRRAPRSGSESIPSTKTKKAQVEWLEAVVGQAQAAGGYRATGLVLVLPGGVRAELTDPQHVALAVELVRALAKPC